MGIKRILLLLALIVAAYFFRYTALIIGSFVSAVVLLVLIFFFGTPRFVSLAEFITFWTVRIFKGAEFAGTIMKLLYIGKETIKKSQTRKNNGSNILEMPNEKIAFPIPQTFSRPGVSEQPKSLVMQQLSVLAKKTDHTVGKVIQDADDKSRKMMDLLRVRDTMRIDEIRSVDLIVNQMNKPNNFVAQEVLFGELMFNGEDPYVAKKYTKYDDYDFPEESADIEKAYQKAILNALTPSNAYPFKDEQVRLLNSVGITPEQLPKLVNPSSQSSDNTYCFFFQHLERITKGETLPGSANIFYDRKVDVQPFKLQTPYAVFTYQEKQNRFICLAVAIRFAGGKIGVYSPFRNPKGHSKQTWKMAKQITAMATFNDFSVRVHLGVLHFTTSQYNVPIYNFFERIDPQKKIQPYLRFQQFLHYTFEIFNRGLEGVNVGATAILVHPTAQLSLINNAFVFSSKTAPPLLADNTNRLNFNKWNPQGLAKKKGLQKLMKVEGSQLNFDNRYFEILGGYVRKMWQVWKMDEFEKKLLDQINNANQSMHVGLIDPKNPQKPENRPLIEKGKLCELFQNLMFSWVIYHSHTYSNIILAPYFEFKPSMLQKELQFDPKPDFNARAALPNVKVLMESVKLTLGTTVRDAGNFIIDVMTRRSEQARINGLGGDNRQADTQKCLNQTIKQLLAVTEDLRNVNEARIKEGKFMMTWLDTSVMESSLNI